MIRDGLKVALFIGTLWLLAPVAIIILGTLLGLTATILLLGALVYVGARIFNPAAAARMRHALGGQSAS